MARKAGTSGHRPSRAALTDSLNKGRSSVKRDKSESGADRDTERSARKCSSERGSWTWSLYTETWRLDGQPAGETYGCRLDWMAGSQCTYYTGSALNTLVYVPSVGTCADEISIGPEIHGLDRSVCRADLHLPVLAVPVNRSPRAGGVVQRCPKTLSRPVHHNEPWMRRQSCPCAGHHIILLTSTHSGSHH